MPTDIKSLRKLEFSVAPLPQGNERVLVLVKLRSGAKCPPYLSPRAQITPEMFSVEMAAQELVRLEADPAVESVSLSKRLPKL